jgi:GR25 family glycosyltransferase involved in LPS biosynthesis/tetratricopeptide (TPR) repeat protein
MSTLCLNMIVKNESHIILETLNGLTNKIKIDYYVICDTGSTDTTVDLIKHFFENKCIKGELHTHQWKDFGTNRSMALDCAYNKSDYVLIFDADDTVIGDFILPTPLTFDAYMLKFGTGFTYERMCLVNNRIKWKYIGVLHEYIKTEQPFTTGKIEGDYHIISGKGGARSKDPNKYLNDAIILKNGYYQSIEDKTDLFNRYSYYCANSYYDAGKYQDAIEWYERTLKCNGWLEEKYNSCVKLFGLYSDTSIEKACYYAVKSYSYNSKRVEGIFCLIKHYCCIHEYTTAYFYYQFIQDYYENEYRQDDLSKKLFANVIEYSFYLPYYMIIVADKINKRSIGLKMYEIIFDTVAPGQWWFDNLVYAPGQWWFDNLVYNSQFYQFEEPLLRKFEKYVSSTPFETGAFFKTVDTILVNKPELLPLWKILYKPSKYITDIPFKMKECSEVSIICTFTTCKRLNLFQQTVRSMIHNWNDLDKVDYFFCVDDNSTQSDRETMKHDFPWIDYYFKSDIERGHVTSMNIIWDKLNEIKPKYWVHIEDDFIFHTNLNYITKAIEGLHALKYSNTKQIVFNRCYGETVDDYTIVSYKNVTPEFCIQDHKPHFSNSQRNSYYWPHYSLRPSLIETESVLKLGKFHFTNGFEMEYAQRWEKAGYTTGFFNRITHTHTGRHTSQRNTDIPNAYTLNNISQFTQETFVYILNLKRRPDRKERMEQQLKDIHFEFFEAVDGETLEPTMEIYNLIKGNDYGSRRGFVGCALSHINLWKKLLESKSEYFLIFEDDCTLSDTFYQKIKEINFRDYELLFLGCFVPESLHEKVGIHPLNKNYIGGTFCYSINKQGAQKMLDYIEKNGIKHGIDYCMKINENVLSFEYNPHIVSSHWAKPGGPKIDTDIQYNTSSLDFSSKLEQFFHFVPGMDQIDNDLYRFKSTFPKMLEKALDDPDCDAFNTLGYYKSSIGVLQKSVYFKSTDGIFIKKKGVKVKMLCNWCSSKELCEEWSAMCDYNFVWKNIEMVYTGDCDYYIIINKTTQYYEPEKTIVFQMEPWVYDQTKNWGVKTWGEWANPTGFKKFHGRQSGVPNVAQWRVSLDKPMDKIDKVLTICSTKYVDTGHIKRIDFLNYTQLIDIYGPAHNLKNYIGPAENKEIMKRYKYYFMVENCFEKDYITEKLWEPIMCECLCFYYGCPNVTDYINPLAFVQLDMDDFEKSEKIIQQAIEEDLWSQRLIYIREAKEKIKNYYGFFPTLQRYI